MMKAVFAALRAAAIIRATAPALREGDTVIGWGELAKRVASLACALDEAPPVIGLGVPGGIDYVVADLAVTLSGRRLTPLPFFFSAEQQSHVIRDAEIGALIGRGPAPLAPGLRVINLDAIPDGRSSDLPDYPGGASRVIYTSGSSGRPKGVIVGDRQLSASLRALAAAIGPTAADRHLSVLPLSQLLEQICGIYLPVLAGAETVFTPSATRALFGGPIDALTREMAEVRPTTSVLAPALLGRWVNDLVAKNLWASDSLRFVAVGGAATPPALLAAATDRRVPVFEGYGLSECCAVVATNRPGDVEPGTVGRVLAPLTVTIEAGEIVVEGPTVMTGYLGGAPVPARWRTGDRGHFRNGRLVIEGRLDALIVTGEGRNISPEWVEARVDADPRVVGSVLCRRAVDDQLVLLVAARAPIELDEICEWLADLPDYARPAEFAFVDPAEPGLLLSSGTPNRAVAARLASSGAKQTKRLAPALQEASFT